MQKLIGWNLEYIFQINDGTKFRSAPDTKAVTAQDAEPEDHTWIRRELAQAEFIPYRKVPIWTAPCAPKSLLFIGRLQGPTTTTFCQVCDPKLNESLTFRVWVFTIWGPADVKVVPWPLSFEFFAPKSPKSHCLVPQSLNHVPKCRIQIRNHRIRPLSDPSRSFLSNLGSANGVSNSDLHFSGRYGFWHSMPECNSNP